ncbi:MAG: serine protease [Acetobacteraceae bacterium]|nr:serine protease [Acetobacteraceae bacterium]
MADLTGLLIGSAIGAALLTQYWPKLEAWVHPPVTIYTPGQAVPPAPSRSAPPGGQALAPFRAPLPATQYPTPSSQSPAPAQGGLPVVQHPGPAQQEGVVAMAPPVAPPPSLPMVQPAPLPTVVHPGSSPAAGTPHWAPGSAYAGTGFFIAMDGSLLTAAHVVAGCSRAQIVSSHVALTVANVLATDTLRDIALLRAAQAQPPAVLPVGDPPAHGRMLVLGYPATAGMLVPEEDWPDLRSDMLTRAGGLAGLRDGVWLETMRITHGYSGGPVVDPRTGTVVAIVRAEITGPAVRAIVGHAGAHMATGPDGERLAGFVHREAPWIDLGRTLSGGEEPIAAARLATVHVICMH